PPRRGPQGDALGDEARLDRDAVESPAQGARHRGDRRDRPPRRGARPRRQHVRQPISSAAAEARSGSRPSLDDEIPRRTLGRRGRSARGQRPGAARAHRVRSERRGWRARSARRVAGSARREDARAPDGAPFTERAGGRGMADRAPEGRLRELSGTPDAPTARAREKADAPLRRHALLRAEGRRGRGETDGRADQALRPWRVAGRRRIADRGAARHDPRLGSRHEARAAGRPGPAFGRHRDGRGSHRGPRASAWLARRLGETPQRISVNHREAGEDSQRALRSRETASTWKRMADPLASLSAVVVPRGDADLYERERFLDRLTRLPLPRSFVFATCHRVELYAVDQTTLPRARGSRLLRG